MTANDPPLLSQLVVRACQFPAAAIAMAGGALQMELGQPDPNPRRDNVHRFMAGGYFSTGLINLWAAITIRAQHTLAFAGLGYLVGRHRQAGVDPARRLARTAHRVAGVAGARTGAAFRDRLCPLRWREIV